MFGTVGVSHVIKRTSLHRLNTEPCVLQEGLSPPFLFAIGSNGDFVARNFFPRNLFNTQVAALWPRCFTSKTLLDSSSPPLFCSQLAANTSAALADVAETTWRRAAAFPGSSPRWGCTFQTLSFVFKAT